MSDASARVSDDVIRQLLGALVDAYNSRDAEAWGRVFHPDALLRPTNLGDPHSASYRGSGVVRFLEEISEGDRGQLIRAREIRRMSADRFAFVNDVFIGDELVAAASAVVCVKDNSFVDVVAFLGDLSGLVASGVVPEAAEVISVLG